MCIKLFEYTQIAQNRIHCGLLCLQQSKQNFRILKIKRICKICNYFTCTTRQQQQPKLQTAHTNTRTDPTPPLLHSRCRQNELQRRILEVCLCRWNYFVSTFRERKSFQSFQRDQQFSSDWNYFSNLLQRRLQPLFVTGTGIQLQLILWESLYRYTKPAAA